MSGLRLLTIPMSHYCEKARWGLERLGCAYTEERHLQGLHYPRTYWFSRGPYVPVLIDGERITTGSARILSYLDNFAAPAEPAHSELLHFQVQIGIRQPRASVLEHRS